MDSSAPSRLTGKKVFAILIGAVALLMAVVALVRGRSRGIRFRATGQVATAVVTFTDEQGGMRTMEVGLPWESPLMRHPDGMVVRFMVTGSSTGPARGVGCQLIYNGEVAESRAGESLVVCQGINR